MKIYKFSSKEIDRYKSDANVWGSFVRRREAEIVFSLFPDRRFQHALELGAGNGVQSVTIINYCATLVSTDKYERDDFLQRQTPNVKYMLCDAQDLSRFSGYTFDLVFSSNMLEHIPDIDKCLCECRRVLIDNGLMLHLMPSRLWKIFNSGLGILKLRNPRVHGASTSWWREFYEFGPSVWKRKIESNGLIVQEVIGMPFYVGLGPSFIPIIKVGNALGMPSSFLYIINKKK